MGQKLYKQKLKMRGSFAAGLSRSKELALKTKNRPGAKMHMYSIVLMLLTIFWVLPTGKGHPSSNLQQAFESMRDVPQWHCLRYRKFDLIKRCRHHRIGYKN